MAFFNSGDLEAGNPAKGLTGATGAGTGGWRLAIESQTLDVEALSYVRTADGFLTAIHAIAPVDTDGVLQIATFNPGSNVDQVSLLRLVNPGTEDAEARVLGVDDAGRSPGALSERRPGGWSLAGVGRGRDRLNAVDVRRSAAGPAGAAMNGSDRRAGLGDAFCNRYHGQIQRHYEDQRQPPPPPTDNQQLLLFPELDIPF